MSSESAMYPPARPPYSIAVVQQYNSVITGAQSISVLVGKLYSLVNKMEFSLSLQRTVVLRRMVHYVVTIVEWLYQEFAVPSLLLVRHPLGNRVLGPVLRLVN